VILIEYDAVATNSQSVAVTAGKTFYIPMTTDSVSYQTFGDLLADIGRQVVEIASSRYRKDNGLHRRNIADLSHKVKRYYREGFGP